MNAELTMDIAEQACRTARMPPDTSAERDILADIHDALAANRLQLPALPDMASRIHDLTGDQQPRMEKILDLLFGYPRVSAYIIKAANSPALSDGKPVCDLRGAISHMGYPMLRSMVMNMAMTGLFQARGPFVEQRLKELWGHSRDVAANSFVLAQQHRHLDPGQAILAGLVHEIGALPLYLYADRHHSRLSHVTMEEAINSFSATLGTQLLKNWNFPDELIDVVARHGNPRHLGHSGAADYVDVVTMANLQMPGIAKFVEWKNAFAAERLGYYPADCKNFLSAHAARLAAVKGMLEVNATLH